MSTYNYGQMGLKALHVGESSASYVDFKNVSGVPTWGTTAFLLATGNVVLSADGGTGAIGVTISNATTNSTIAETLTFADGSLLDRHVVLPNGIPEESGFVAGSFSQVAIVENMAVRVPAFPARIRNVTRAVTRNAAKTRPVIRVVDLTGVRI